MKRLILTLLASAAVISANAETYTIDSAHSSVGFNVKHNLVSRVPGSFTTFSGTISYDAAAPEKSSAQATIDVGSVSTNNEKRDGHLKTPDFFDVAKFGSITFKSTSWKKTGADTFDVTGDLTIRDVTKSVVLKTTLTGSGPGMGGSTVTGWEATTTINRRDFGVNGPAMLGKVVSDEVNIVLSVEAGHK